MVSAYLGVDPGAKGFICLLVPEEDTVRFMSNAHKPYDIFIWLTNMKVKYNIRIAMIEDVHSIYGMSAKSNFTFGFNTGLISGLLQALGVGVDKVAPKKWQKEIGVKTKGKAIKNEVGEICERLYPKVNIRGPKGGLMDGMSDALMITHYAYLTYN